MIQYLTYLSKSFSYRKVYDRNGFVKPVFINYLCTFKCHARCTMCHIWQLYKDTNSADLLKQELTTAELADILRKNAEFLNEVRHIGLTGGDPPMRNDIVELIHALRTHLPQAAIGMQTNGLTPKLLKKQLAEIVAFYPEFSLAVSLDGIGEVHDRMRGVDNAFEKALESIRFAQELGIQRITTGMTLTNANAHQIGEIAALASELNTEFSCFLADESEYFQNTGQKGSLLPEKKHIIIESLKQHAQYNYFMDKLRRKIEFNEKRTLPCYSGHTSLVWDPYGNVKPCILRTERFGNLKEQTLVDMLFNDDAHTLKEEIKKCTCWNQCEVSSSAMIDVNDVLYWWAFACRDKLGFLNHLIKK